jgi:DNA polymerase-3 subunit gamma/tau
LVGYQSLYRRYRSQNFEQLVGQSTTVAALRTAVAEGRHSHAYLFSGPRGTGKTSTARILAKALNCQNLTDGESCTTCESCVQIEAGASFDLHELDAASNNKVDDVRDLIAKVALGSPGRTKVYILDEVHMLTSGAENALLKTLEEPPEHVVFVLATTEPHKVVPTIRSRTQHFEFNLIGAEDLEKHIRWVASDAGLDITDEGFAFALRKGGGSARDTLSALDLVAAAGGVPRDSNIGAELAAAVGAGDSAAAIKLVQRGLEAGREPRTIGEETLTVLRNGFLASMGAELNHLNEADTATALTLASDLGPGTLTRALEVLGKALVEMRQAADPRVPLEVALLTLARRDGNEISALIARIEALESQIQNGAPAAPPSPQGQTQTTPPAATPAAPSPAAAPEPAPQPIAAQAPQPAPTRTAAPPVPTAQRQTAPKPVAQTEAKSGRPRPADEARAKLAEAQTEARNAPATNKAQPKPAAPEPAPTPAPVAKNDQPVDLATVKAAFAGGLLDACSQKVRARFRSGNFTSIDGDEATFAVPNVHVVSRCVEVKADVEAALGNAVGRNITITVVADAGDGPPPEMTEAAPQPKVLSDDADEVLDVTELTDAKDVASNSIDRITQAFPGAKVIDGSAS